MSEHTHNDSDKHARVYGEGANAPDGVDLTLSHGDDHSAESESLAPVIVFLVVIFGALALWGGTQIIHGTQGFDPLVYNPYQEKVTGPIEPPSLASIGKKVYTKNCATCHMADGNGVAGAFPTLHETPWVTGNEERVVNILLSGLAGPIEVNGKTYNGNMPAWGAALSDKQIAGVITYIRTNEAWGNTATEVTEEQVAAVRAQYGVRAQAWSAEELLSLFPDTDAEVQ